VPDVTVPSPEVVSGLPAVARCSCLCFVDRKVAVEAAITLLPSPPSFLIWPRPVGGGEWVCLVCSRTIACSLCAVHPSLPRCSLGRRP
jgi:hypothetical protein